MCQDKQQQALRGTINAHKALMLFKGYLQVLKDLGGDSRLDEFRSQYEKVLQAVRRSHGQLYA